SFYILPILFSLLVVAVVLFALRFNLRDFLRAWARGDYALFFTLPTFLFLFVPATLFSFHILERTIGERALVPLLIFASLVFYSTGWLSYLWFLIAYLTLNFAMPQILRSKNPRWASHKRQVLVLIIVINLISLAFFKYTNFLLGAIEGLADIKLAHLNIFLPL